MSQLEHLEGELWQKKRSALFRLIMKKREYWKLPILFVNIQIMRLSNKSRSKVLEWIVHELQIIKSKVSQLASVSILPLTQTDLHLLSHGSYLGSHNILVLWCPSWSLLMSYIHALILLSMRIYSLTLLTSLNIQFYRQYTGWIFQHIAPIPRMIGSVQLFVAV